VISEYNFKRPLNEYCYEINDHYGGIQKLYQFDNHMGASVIRHERSYGSELGLWEVAVLDEAGQLVYDTPVMGDVMGHLSWKEVSKVLRQIQAL
jgi:hypothetical protein